MLIIYILLKKLLLFFKMLYNKEYKKNKVQKRIKQSGRLIL